MEEVIREEMITMIEGSKEEEEATIEKEGTRIGTMITIDKVVVDIEVTKEIDTVIGIIEITEIEVIEEIEEVIGLREVGTTTGMREEDDEMN